jgi:hypothetical protein
MQNWQRYRLIAAECLSAALAFPPRERLLRLSIAQSWLELARQDERMNALLALWDASTTS